MLDIVLSVGSPWPMPGCYLILKLWEACISPSLVDISLFSTKITLWELPLEYWFFHHLTRVVEPLDSLISIEGEHLAYSNIRVCEL